MSFTTEGEKLILKLLLLTKTPIGQAVRDTDITGDDKLYLGLHTTAKMDETSGDRPTIVEPSNGLNLNTFLSNANAVDDDTNYYRIPLDNALATVGSELEMFDEAAIDAHTEGAVSNSSIIQFGQAAANWGTIYSWFIINTPDLTQPHTGRIMGFGDLTVPVTVNQNDRLAFQVGALAVTLK